MNQQLVCHLKLSSCLPSTADHEEELTFVAAKMFSGAQQEHTKLKGKIALQQTTTTLQGNKQTKLLEKQQTCHSWCLHQPQPKTFNTKIYEFDNNIGLTLLL